LDCFVPRNDEVRNKNKKNEILVDE